MANHLSQRVLVREDDTPSQPLKRHAAQRINAAAKINGILVISLFGRNVIEVPAKFVRLLGRCGIGVIEKFE